MKKRSHKRRTGIDRRTFLKAAGLGAGAFFLPSLGQPSNASAEPATRPRRVVFLMSELGWNPHEFRMKPPGAPEEVLLRSAYHPTYRYQPDPLKWELDLKHTPREEFSKVLEPLYDLREHALVLDGLGMLSIGLDGMGDDHARGWNHALSGHPSGTFLATQRAMGGAPSIDMRIARHLRDHNPHLTDLTALQFYVNDSYGGGGVNTFHHYFYDAGPSGTINKVPVEPDPRRVFARLFSGGNREDVEVRAEGKVLDALTSRYRATFPHLSSRDRQKLELHRQTIRDIQRRNDILSTLECSTPSEPRSLADLDRQTAFETNVENFFDLTSVALSCDLARVVSMQLPNCTGARLGKYGAEDRDFHAWYSHGAAPTHRWRGVDGGNVTQVEYDNFMSAAPIMGNKNRYHVELAAKLARRFQSIPDGDGTLLDSTLIVLMDELSHGSHGHDQWPVVMLGGFGGAFRTGRYIRFPRTNPMPRMGGMGAWAGVPHSHLLISICQEMGLELDDLGVQSVYARDSTFAGQSVSLTGRLEQLY